MFLRRPGVRLQGRVTNFHDVSVTGYRKIVVGQVPVHDVPPAGAEPKLDRRGVADDRVTAAHCSGELGQIVSAVRFGILGETHEHPLQPGTFAEDLGDHSGTKGRHDYFNVGAAGRSPYTGYR